MYNKSDLGIEENIDGVTLKELLNDEPALKMLLHNYQKIGNENKMLKQDLERQATIERIRKKEDFLKIAAIFSLLSNITLSFGVNFITNSNMSGWFFWEQDYFVKASICILVF